MRQRSTSHTVSRPARSLRHDLRKTDPRGTPYDRVVGLILAFYDVSEAMVKAGAAWEYPQYNRDPEIPVLEAQARAGRFGLWAAPAPIAPWDWRHRDTPLR